MTQYNINWVFLNPALGAEEMLRLHRYKIDKDLERINAEVWYGYASDQLIDHIGWSLDHDRDIPRGLPEEFKEYFLFVIAEIDYSLNQFTGARHELVLAQMNAEALAGHILWLGERNLPIRGNGYLAKKVAEILNRPETEVMQAFGVERIAENA